MGAPLGVVAGLDELTVACAAPNSTANVLTISPFGGAAAGNPGDNTDAATIITGPAAADYSTYKIPGRTTTWLGSPQSFSEALSRGKA